MTKAGYLQLKISELNDKLIQISNKTEYLMETFRNKELIINNKIKQISEAENKLKIANIEKDKHNAVLKEILLGAKTLQKQSFGKMHKNVVSDLNALLIKIKKELSFTIADNIAGNILTLKILVDKNIINSEDFDIYVHKYYDDIVKDISKNHTLMSYKSFLIQSEAVVENEGQR